MLDTAAVLLVRYAETRQSFWGWTTDEWIHLLGRTQTEFRRHAPERAGDEVRPYLASHAYLLGSVTEFHRLGSYQRLTLSWKIFGKEPVIREIARLRTVLSQWGYERGRDDGSLLPMVTCQPSLFNHSPHLEDLNTDLFAQFRNNRLLQGARLNTLHALQRALAALGFCNPPQHRIAGQSPKATGGAPVWEQWVDRWHATSTLTPPTRRQTRSNLLKGMWPQCPLTVLQCPTLWVLPSVIGLVEGVEQLDDTGHSDRTTYQNGPGSRT